jgi:hypothetical protein
MEGVAQTQLEQQFHLASTSNLPAPLAESFLIQGLVAPDQLHQGNPDCYFFFFLFYIISPSIIFFLFS